MKQPSLKKKEKKRKFHPLKRQLEILFIGLLVLSICSITLINILFLEKYYITRKTEVLKSAMSDLQALHLTEDEEENESAEIPDTLRRTCSQNNLSWVVITADGQKVAAIGGNEAMLQARLIGYAYDLDKKTTKYKLLEETESYVIQQVNDRFAGMDYLESWGNLEEGYFFLIRTPLESIRESVSISNSFYFVVGI